MILAQPAKGTLMIHFSGVQAEPEETQDDVQVVTAWRGGMVSESVCGEDLPGILSDEPPALGGQGSAVNPQQLMLAAFNACMTATFVCQAQRRNIRLQRLDITSRATLNMLPANTDEPLCPGRLSYVIRVAGEASLAQFDSLHQAVIAGSPNRWLLAQNMTIIGDLVVDPR